MTLARAHNRDTVPLSKIRRTMIDPRTERRLLDGGPAHPSDQKSVVIEGAFSKTEITTTLKDRR